VIVSCLSQL